ncbi:unnamed protein product [Symbiodinium natans]|uniref:Glycosyltransferase 2-like domain-containing protein n=1 Tax=Symbiodinium natans TaxID=878477 RepID=A0A812UVJ6_9DINO|nr:unnamed protein product [Symbiodinium natans]
MFSTIGLVLFGLSWSMFVPSYLDPVSGSPPGASNVEILWTAAFGGYSLFWAITCFAVAHLADRLQVSPSAFNLPCAPSLHTSTDQAVQLELAYQLIEAGLMDFQGKAKPWLWPPSVHARCASFTAFAGVWQAILLAPGQRWVRWVLDHFDTDQRLLNVNKPMPASVIPLVEQVLNVALQVQLIPGSVAHSQVLGLLCGAGVVNKHDVWTYFVDTTAWVEAAGKGEICRAWRSFKKERGAVLPQTMELSGWVPTPEVSVVIPCTLRDAQRKFALGEMLRTVLEQTLKPLEVIVALSNATADEAAAVETKLSRFLDTIPVIVDAVEGPASSAQNRDRGLRRARGDILSVFDADDLMHPQRIELISKAFHAKPDLKLLLHSYFPLFNNSQPRTCPHYDLNDRLHVLPSRDLAIMEEATRQVAHLHDTVHEIFNSGIAMSREVVDIYTYSDTPEAATKEDDSGFVRAVVRGYGARDGPRHLEEGDWALYLDAELAWYRRTGSRRRTAKDAQSKASHGFGDGDEYVASMLRVGRLMDLVSSPSRYKVWDRSGGKTLLFASSVPVAISLLRGLCFFHGLSFDTPLREGGRKQCVFEAFQNALCLQLELQLEGGRKQCVFEAFQNALCLQLDGGQVLVEFRHALLVVRPSVLAAMTQVLHGSGRCTFDPTAALPPARDLANQLRAIETAWADRPYMTFTQRGKTKCNQL